MARDKAREQSVARWAIKKMAAHKKKAAIKCDKPTNKSCLAEQRKSQRVILHRERGYLVRGRHNQTYEKCLCLLPLALSLPFLALRVV